jgi:hypothetical protein
MDKEQKFAPIIIPTLNRIDKFKNCVESLAKNLYADKTELYIGLDALPEKNPEKYEEGYKQICAYIPTITGFKVVNVIKREKNLGVIENCKDLFRIVLEKHDTFIFSEDDNIFAPAFLSYVNHGLEKFKDDKSIRSICGYSYPIDYPESNANVVKMQTYCSDWGFGTWKDRYTEIRDVMNQNYFIDLFKSRKKAKLLRKTSRKNFIWAFGCLPPSTTSIRPMDYTRSVFQIMNNQYSIMPKISLVKNTGWDLSGVHSLPDTEHIRNLCSLFNNQKLYEKSEFDTFCFFDDETESINKQIDKTIFGAYEKKYYPKVVVKATLFRLGLLGLVRKILKKNASQEEIRK